VKEDERVGLDACRSLSRTSVPLSNTGIVLGASGCPAAVIVAGETRRLVLPRARGSRLQFSPGPSVRSSNVRCGRRMAERLVNAADDVGDVGVVHARPQRHSEQACARAVRDRQVAMRAAVTSAGGR
jgi:hypothetical protein